MSNFIPGLELSRLFFLEAVQPVLRETAPELAYSAALIGNGSEILGFDTEMSADHGWGPRLQIFLREDDVPQFRNILHEALRHRLPARFRGYSTNFVRLDPPNNTTRLLKEVESGPLDHLVEFYTLRGLVDEYLNFDIEEPIAAADWLTFPEQKLLTLTAGAVFHDEIGLQALRDRFAYYPHDVWLYLLAAGWNRISQEEALMGRAGIVGDEIGSAVIAARLARDVMRLGFLMERRYAPYQKWFGRAFKDLECAAELGPILTEVLAARTWQKREAHLIPAYEYIARMHNGLGITAPLPGKTGDFWGRPFQVIEQTGGFAAAIRERITDPEVKRIAGRNHIGSLDQLSDNTDLLSDSRWRLVIRRLYE